MIEIKIEQTIITTNEDTHVTVFVNGNEYTLREKEGNLIIGSKKPISISPEASNTIRLSQ